MAIINSKNVYKLDKDTSLIFFVLTMISMDIAMVMAIHMTSNSIVWQSIEPTFSSIYPLPKIVWSEGPYFSMAGPVRKLGMTNQT